MESSMRRDAAKHEHRLRRQFDAVVRFAPASRGVVHTLIGHKMRLFRIPLAILLILGSFLAILPVFGLWMFPVGVMLLAVDIPRLRPRVSAAIIRVRRRWAVWRHKQKRR